MNNEEFHKKYDDKEITLDELQFLFSEPGYICLGHGTGRSSDSLEIINSILSNGLRTKDNSLYYTTIVLSTPTPEIIKQNQYLGIPIPTMDSLKKQLDNWEHMNSKNIIIIRIPTKYINWHGDRSDLDGEMYGAFMNEIVQDNGIINYYLDSRFILGYYNADTHLFIINKEYEKELTDETKKDLNNKYANALKKTENRLNNLKRPFKGIK